MEAVLGYCMRPTSSQLLLVYYKCTDAGYCIILQHTAVVVEILEKDQADVNYQDDAGRTALMLRYGSGERRRIHGLAG
ncbi:hypothetical protein BJX96DRAFT_157134 [Aspergillus floccosus]